MTKSILEDFRVSTFEGEPVIECQQCGWSVTAAGVDLARLVANARAHRKEQHS
jgi:hypothetical protein